MSDGGDTQRNRVSQASPLKIPERTPIVFGFMTCARAAGKSVRECACKIKGGGWLECPPEFRGVLARSEATTAAAEWTAKLPTITLATAFTPPDTPPLPQQGFFNGPVPITAPPIYRPDPPPIGDIEPEPKTPQQIAAAIAAERADFKRMQSRQASAKGYTGNFCDHCGSSRMRHNGTCEVCEECGETGACG